MFLPCSWRQSRFAPPVSRRPSLPRWAGILVVLDLVRAKRRSRRSAFRRLCEVTSASVPLTESARVVEAAGGRHGGGLVFDGVGAR